ncbi:MAG: hypothetical protein FJ095_06685 [Deltaproteobacteria bacterium]|nr:hypothetical protein [Deltaproteobacteria bacterium]
MRPLLLAALLLGAVTAHAEEAVAPPEVSLSKPKLTGGTIGELEAALERTREGVASCVSTHGGLSGDAGRLDVQFLVRERGRAEGVEVTRAQKVSTEAAQCVQKLLRNRPIGTPTDDPVGVLYAYKLRRR